MSKPVVVITGASRGIGLAVTEILLQNFNAIVVTLSRTRTHELRTLHDRFHAGFLSTGNDAVQTENPLQIIECDVTDEDALSQAIAGTVDKHGRIDGLILNAGIVNPMGRIDSLENNIDSWKMHFDVNFFSLVTTLKAALPALRKSELGRVVFVSSGAAEGGTAGWGPYNASKAAMNSLCRTLAQEETGIVSVALRPGMVDTNMQATLRSTAASSMKETDYNRFVRAHAEGKLVKPVDAGYAIASLSVRAPKSLSGRFITWDSPECQALTT